MVRKSMTGDQTRAFGELGSKIHYRLHVSLDLAAVCSELCIPWVIYGDYCDLTKNQWKRDEAGGSALSGATRDRNCTGILSCLLELMFLREFDAGPSTL